MHDCFTQKYEEASAIFFEFRLDGWVGTKQISSLSGFLVLWYRFPNQKPYLCSLQTKEFCESENVKKRQSKHHHDGLLQESS